MHVDPDDPRYAAWKQAEQARRLQEGIARLQARWRHYNFPTQETLELILKTTGFQAAELATIAVEKSHAC